MDKYFNTLLTLLIITTAMYFMHSGYKQSYQHAINRDMMDSDVLLFTTF
jgi:hypothetical protein